MSLASLNHLSGRPGSPSAFRETHCTKEKKGVPQPDESGKCCLLPCSFWRFTMPVSTAKAAKSCNKKPALNRQNPINFSSSMSYFSNLFEPRLPFPILGINSPRKMPPEVFKALQTLGPTHRPLLSHLWCFPPSPLGPTPLPSDPALPPAPPTASHVLVLPCWPLRLQYPSISFCLTLGASYLSFGCRAQAPPPPRGPPYPPLPMCIHST